MARTALTVTNVPASTASAGVAVTWDAGDASNNNDVVLTGREIVLVRNTSTGNARTVTVPSVACPHGRTGDITAESLALSADFANQIVHVLPLFKTDGWRQSDGKLYINPSHAELVIAVLRLP